MFKAQQKCPPERKPLGALGGRQQGWPCSPDGTLKGWLSGHSWSRRMFRAEKQETAIGKRSGFGRGVVIKKKSWKVILKKLKRSLGPKGKQHPHHAEHLGTPHCLSTPVTSSPFKSHAVTPAWPFPSPLTCLLSIPHMALRTIVQTHRFDHDLDLHSFHSDLYWQTNFQEPIIGFKPPLGQLTYLSLCFLPRKMLIITSISQRP